MMLIFQTKLNHNGLRPSITTKNWLTGWNFWANCYLEIMFSKFFGANPFPLVNYNFYINLFSQKNIIIWLICMGHNWRSCPNYAYFFGDWSAIVLNLTEILHVSSWDCRPSIAHEKSGFTSLFNNFDFLDPFWRENGLTSNLNQNFGQLDVTFRSTVTYTS